MRLMYIDGLTDMIAWLVWISLRVEVFILRDKKVQIPRYRQNRFYQDVRFEAYSLTKRRTHVLSRRGLFQYQLLSWEFSFDRRCNMLPTSIIK